MKSSAVDLKIILLGASGVGKSSILRRIVYHKFENNLSSTVGCDYCTKTLDINGMRIDATLWDTAGQERFKALTRMYYSDTDIVFLVFNPNNSSSLSDMKTFYEEVVASNTNPVFPVVIATHMDMLTEEKNTLEEAEKFVDSIHAKLFKVSCMMDNENEMWDRLLSENVKAFVDMYGHLLETRQEETMFQHQELEDMHSEPKKSKCC